VTRLAEAARERNNLVQGGRPSGTERISQRRLSFSSRLTACAQVSLLPAARVKVKSGGTRSTYAWPRVSKNSRSWVQLP